MGCYTVTSVNAVHCSCLIRDLFSIYGIISSHGEIMSYAESG